MGSIQLPEIFIMLIMIACIPLICDICRIKNIKFFYKIGTSKHFKSVNTSTDIDDLVRRLKTTDLVFSLNYLNKERIILIREQFKLSGFSKPLRLRCILKINEGSVTFVVYYTASNIYIPLITLPIIFFIILILFINIYLASVIAIAILIYSVILGRRIIIRYLSMFEKKVKRIISDKYEMSESVRNIFDKKKAF
jgi:hypothetical protein